MNKIILMGRLTRDPEVRYTTTGKVVCQFTLAVERPFTNQDGQREADFINIVVWGKIAELCGNSLTKGQRALVDGRLQLRSYDAKTAVNVMLPKLLQTAWNLLNARVILPAAIPATAARATWSLLAPRCLLTRKSHFNKEGLSE